MRATTTGRTGRSPGDTKASILAVPPCERITPVIVRTQALEVPTQIVATRDGATVKVDATIYFRVIDARRALLGGHSILNSPSKLAQTWLRRAIEETTLDDLLNRVNLHVRLHAIVDRHMAVWGMKVTIVEVNHVEIQVDPASVWTAGALCNERDLARLRNINEFPWPKQ